MQTWVLGGAPVRVDVAVRPPLALTRRVTNKWLPVGPSKRCKWCKNQYVLRTCILLLLGILDIDNDAHFYV